MSNPDPEKQIQSERSAVSLARPDPGDLLPSDDTPQKNRTRMAGTVFGALAGIPLGVLAGAVGCWLADYGDYAWHGVLCGTVVGVFFGATVGFVERTLKGDVAKPVVACAIGSLFGLAVAPLSIFNMDAGCLFLCGGPVGGFVFGSLLDRVFELGVQRSWFKASAIALMTAVACVYIAFLVVEYSDPDPRDVEKATAKAIAVSLQFNGAKNRKITLGPPEHRKYTGTLEVVFDDGPELYDLIVNVRHNKVDATWVPRN